MGSLARRLQRSRLAAACVALLHVATASAAGAPDAGAVDAELFSSVDRIFADYALDAHLPGLVYGIVAHGRLVHVYALGVQELDTKRPVTADTLFRIASMTKAFTALTVLKLRDDGKLQLDALAETTSRSFGAGSTRHRTRGAFACATC